MRALAQEHPGLTLAQFLAESGLDLSDVYANNKSWSDLREAAGIPQAAKGPHEEALRRACGRLLHVDDPERLNTWREWLAQDTAPHPVRLSPPDNHLMHMLLAQMLDQVRDATTTLGQGAELLWAHAEVRKELVELFDVLLGLVTHLPIGLDAPADVPLSIHARYTRLEMLAAAASADRVKVRAWREGIFHDEALKSDFCAFTLDKTSGQFSPTTRYKDYAISRELIHWESQSGTRASSPTGQRFQHHASTGDHILLFGRLNTDDRAFYFLGPATYMSHVGEMPMAITWRLQHPLPGDLFQVFAAAVA